MMTVNGENDSRSGLFTSKEVMPAVVWLYVMASTEIPTPTSIPNLGHSVVLTNGQ